MDRKKIKKVNDLTIEEGILLRKKNMLLEDLIRVNDELIIVKEKVLEVMAS